MKNEYKKREQLTVVGIWPITPTKETYLKLATRQEKIRERINNEWIDCEFISPIQENKNVYKYKESPHCSNTQNTQELEKLGLKIRLHGNEIFNLEERTYKLIITENLDLFISITLTLRPNKNHITPEDIKNLCSNRKITENLGQERALHKIASTAEKIISDLLEEQDQKNLLQQNLGNFFPVLVFDEKPETGVYEIFDQDEDVPQEKVQEGVYIGWNYAVISKENKNLAQTICEIAHFQNIYCNVRILQNLFLSEMKEREQTIEKHIHEKLIVFNKLIKAQQQIALDHERHMSSLPPRLHNTFTELEKRWNLDTAIEQTNSSARYYFEFTQNKASQATQRIATKQNRVLWIISSIQLFSTISIANDYLSLKSGLLSISDQKSVAANHIAEKLSENELQVLDAISNSPLFIATLLIIITLFTSTTKKNTKPPKKRNKKISLWNKNVEVKKSIIHGHGLFSKVDFQPKEEIYRTPEGIVVDHTQMEDSNITNSEWNALPEDKYLLRENKSLYYFINHSRTAVAANAVVEIEGNIAVVRATTPIGPGDEILIDYLREPLSDAYINEHGIYL